MIQKPKVLLGLLTLILSVSMLGCTNPDYERFRQSFLQSYINVSNSITSKEMLESLRKIELEENKNELIKMNSLLGEIDPKVPKSMKEDYNQLARWYQELASLQGVYNEWDDLSAEDKMEIGVKLRSMRMRSSWIKEKKI